MRLKLKHHIEIWIVWSNLTIIDMLTWLHEIVIVYNLNQRLIIIYFHSYSKLYYMLIWMERDDEMEELFVGGFD
jgi:hypothetical protein